MALYRISWKRQTTPGQRSEKDDRKEKGRKDKRGEDRKMTEIKDGQDRKLLNAMHEDERNTKDHSKCK